MKAADISTDDVMASIRRHRTNIGASFWNMATDFDGVPEKVLRAKLSKMIRRGLIDGCGACECRGDYDIIEPKGPR